MLNRLKHSRFAWWARGTPLYRMWRRLRDPAQARLADRERAFYRTLLGPLQVRTILDIGANVGSKTDIFRSLASRVVAVEPDPNLGERLRYRFRHDPRVVVEETAVAAAVGTIEFFKFENSQAYNTASREWAQYLVTPTSRSGAAHQPPVTINVPAVTLADLLKRHGPVQFLKIDVEGLEWSVLSTLSNSPPPCISLEFNLPMFWPQLLRCIGHLERLDPSYLFNAVITEPPQRFELETWLPGDQLVAMVTERCWEYVELYARTNARVS